jgi:hypothetical protein
VKSIAIYNQQGRIDRLLSCPENLIAANIQAGEFWLEASENISDSTHRVVDNAFLPYPPKPESYFVWDWSSNQWVDPRTTETQWPIVRQKRNQLLQQSDWTDTASALARLGQELYNQWQTYRQALRDVTDQPDPFNITWPTPPQ